MIFSKKEKPVVAYTMEKCQSCKGESKRKFREGDVLFKRGNECPSCKTPTTITKIFGETIES